MPDFDHEDRPIHPDDRFEAGRRRDALEDGELVEDARRDGLAQAARRAREAGVKRGSDRDGARLLGQRRTVESALDDARVARAELAEAVAELGDRLESVLEADHRVTEGEDVSRAIDPGEAPIVQALDEHAESLAAVTRRVRALTGRLAL